MDKYLQLVSIKPPQLQTNYLSSLVPKNDITFTHKTLNLRFLKGKKYLREVSKPGKIVGKKGGAKKIWVF